MFDRNLCESKENNIEGRLISIHRVNVQHNKDICMCKATLQHLRMIHSVHCYCDKF